MFVFQVVVVKEETSDGEKKGRPTPMVMRNSTPKKRWNSTPWKRGSSLFDGVGWEKKKKKEIPLELNSSDSFGAFSFEAEETRRTKKAQEGPRRTLAFEDCGEVPLVEGGGEIIFNIFKMENYFQISRSCCQ